MISFTIIAALSACAEFDVDQKRPTEKVMASPATQTAPIVAPQTPAVEADLCKDPVNQFPVKPDLIYRFENTGPNTQTFEIPLASHIEKYLLPLDVLFLLDTTQSMQSELNLMKERTQSVLNEIRKQAKDAAFGIATFDDFPIEPWGKPNVDSPFTLVSPIATNDQPLIQSLQAIVLHDGGDLPESWIEALYRLASREDVGWRKNSQRLVILITDAPAHNFDLPGARPRDAVGPKAAVTELLKKGIQVIGIASIPKFPGNLDTLTEETSSVLLQSEIDALKELKTSADIAIRELAGIATLTRALSTVDLPDAGIKKSGPMLFVLEKGQPETLVKGILAGVKNAVDIHRNNVTIDLIKPPSAGSEALVNKIQIVTVDSNPMSEKDRIEKLLVDSLTTTQLKTVPAPVSPNAKMDTKIRFVINNALQSCRTQQFAFRVRITDKKADTIIINPALNTYSLGSEYAGMSNPSPETVIVDKIIGVEIVKSEPKSEANMNDATKTDPGHSPVEQPSPVKEGVQK